MLCMAQTHNGWVFMDEYTEIRKYLLEKLKYSLSFSG
jgi:predicted ATPase with chaperone activity